MNRDILNKLRTYREKQQQTLSAVQTDSTASGEVEHLKTLVKELLPFMFEDVRQGLMLGEAPFDQSHCVETEEKCPDCTWFNTSVKWRERIERGEFQPYV